MESTSPPIPHAPVPTGGDLGKPAELVGCDILLNGAERIVLRLNGLTLTLPEPGLVGSYKIAFSNTCYDSPAQRQYCQFDWQNFKETMRNDFYHHRDILPLKSYVSKYAVILGEDPRLIGRGNQDKFNTNEAPCMAAGYGGGNGPCNC